MISKARCSKFIKLFKVIFGYDFDNVHTDVHEKHEYMWALGFYEKKTYKVIFIRQDLWMIIYI